MLNEVIKLSSPATREFWEIPVLFEDEHLLAMDKPAGLLISPDRDDPLRPNLMKLLHGGIAEGKPWAVRRGLTYLMNAHRLDFDTSGVILLTRDKPTLVRLAEMFGAEIPSKRHLALVRGAPAEDRFEINAKLGPHPTRPGVMRVDAKRGKRSRTMFQVEQKFDGFALLRCELLTDRTHQVRVHLAHAGLRLVADPVYGGPPLLLSRLKRDYHLKKDQVERPLMGRVALHAEELHLPHPVSGRPLSIAAPWPKDFTVTVKYLNRYAGGRME